LTQEGVGDQKDFTVELEVKMNTSETHLHEEVH